MLLDPVAVLSLKGILTVDLIPRIYGKDTNDFSSYYKIGRESPEVDRRSRR